MAASYIVDIASVYMPLQMRQMAVVAPTHLTEGIVIGVLGRDLDDGNRGKIADPASRASFFAGDHLERTILAQLLPIERIGNNDVTGMYRRIHLGQGI